MQDTNSMERTRHETPQPQNAFAQITVARTQARKYQNIHKYPSTGCGCQLEQHWLDICTQTSTLHFFTATSTLAVGDGLPATKKYKRTQPHRQSNMCTAWFVVAAPPARLAPSVPPVQQHKTEKQQHQTAATTAAVTTTRNQINNTHRAFLGQSPSAHCMKQQFAVGFLSHQ